MGRRKTAVAVLALIFSLFSLTAVYAANEKGAAEQPRYVTFQKVAENAEVLHGEYIPVLMYHHFALQFSEKGNGMITTVSELEEHLKYFQMEGWRVISLEELDQILKKVEKKKADTQDETMGLQQKIKYLCITMDDGYFSNYDLAYPLFKKYRVPASIFAVTDAITEQSGIRKFSWKQAAEMEASGTIKIYSHSADHIPVEEEQEEVFLESMQKSEVSLAENLKEERIKAMAYPNGRNTALSQELLAEEGYQMQFTIDPGVVTAHTPRTSMPRITVESGMTGQDVIQKIELTAEKVFAAAESEGNET